MIAILPLGLITSERGQVCHCGAVPSDCWSSDGTLSEEGLEHIAGAGPGVPPTIAWPRNLASSGQAYLIFYALNILQYTSLHFTLCQRRSIRRT